MSPDDLKNLIRSRHPLLAIATIEEERATRILVRISEELLLPVFTWTLTAGLCRWGETRPLDPRSTQPALALQHLLDLELAALFLFHDLDEHLQAAPVARLLWEVCARFRDAGSTLILLGAQPELPPKIRAEAISFSLRLPGREELGRTLDETLRTMALRHAIETELSGETREAILSSLQGLTENQARQALAQAILEDHRLDPSDVGTLQRHKAALLMENGPLVFHSVADQDLDLGGFGNLRAWLDRARHGFSGRARELNLEPPRGILLLGVQGCGKSLAAKVIARSWDLPLLQLDAGRLYDKFIGESERNFRQATELAGAMAPCVLWIDELEKAFSQGGDASSDGGTSQRILASFLTWLQEKKEAVFLVATANRIESLPPELLRKGRFDEIFFVDLPSAQEREAIFSIHLGRHRQAPGAFDLAALARATEGFSGAEIGQAVVAALYRTLERGIGLDTAVLLEEVSETRPLSQTHREEIARLRAYARDRFVPVTLEQGG